jgi:hypothetical protein
MRLAKPNVITLSTNRKSASSSESGIRGSRNIGAATSSIWSVGMSGLLAANSLSPPQPIAQLNHYKISNLNALGDGAAAPTGLAHTG